MPTVFIIAEAGVNHNGKISLAKKLVECAAQAGVDAVKFQTFVPEDLVSGNACKANYQMESTSADESQIEMLKAWVLSRSDHLELLDHCKKHNLIFLSSPFDLESISFLASMGLSTFKVPSGEIANLPYLRRIGGLGKKIILSTGMSEMAEVALAIEILINAGTSRENISLLHCNTEYPTPMEDVNLLAMLAIQREFNLNVGYSDHSIGIEVAIAAVAMGASIIEKHFTLDNKMKGPDHKASLEIDQLRNMVKSIRNIELALGNGIKTVSKSEKKNIAVVRKSIVAKRPISKGELFSEENISTKRPGHGLSPMLWDKILGERAKKHFTKDELIEL